MIPEVDVWRKISPSNDVESRYENWKGITDRENLSEQEKSKARIKTIYEDDNWKYIWPINDYSFCELAKDTNWCKDGEKYFEGYGTSYILQDKKSDPKMEI